MRKVIKATSRARRKVQFTHNPSRAHTRSSRSHDQSSQRSIDRGDALSESDAVRSRSSQAGMGSDTSQPDVPWLFTSTPLIKDHLVTETSILQNSTVAGCLPFLVGTANPGTSLLEFNAHGLPYLERQIHIEFLLASLEKLPSGFVPYDASRPWIVYWALTGLSLLGKDISPYQERVVQTFTPSQNASGGFGGGHGQTSHCLASYAAVLSLSMVGGQEALNMIDRRALWRWLGQLKQSCGGFAVTVGGEIDVRGAYCAMVMIALLCLPLDLPQDAPARQQGLTSFVDELPQWLSRCQTYEGGISGAPGTEAHGAYAFCALACLSIIGDPRDVLTKFVGHVNP
ncbi:hypothetical protein MMC19_002980 [Ptychographa xylographoides]|nr:hypothetical protein [Ptychographa xylographoides]